jgi:DNA mismatch repair ATPase MutS
VFAKFSHTAEHDYRIHFAGAPEANAVEGQILERVALLFPPVFDELQAFCDRNCSYLEPAIARFEREVQFYLAYLAYVARFRRRGLPLCYPDVQMADKASFCEDAYDFALACKLDLQNVQVVCNDFHLEGSERILVITGPNQGGKTTFARAFGQVYYLGSLGCPVAGRAARLFLCDRILTHFEAEEHVADLRSKLEDDLLRLRKLLALATPRSIIILNEVLSSTSLHDALYLGRRMMARLSALDALCVYVTFLDELAGFDDKTVSMVSTVGGEDLALRTYKLVRKEADGLAYAHSLALKHRLTYAGIKERIKA